jgi:hypothetical protein
MKRASSMIQDTRARRVFLLMSSAACLSSLSLDDMLQSFRGFRGYIGIRIWLDWSTYDKMRPLYWTWTDLSTAVVWMLDLIPQHIWHRCLLLSLGSWNSCHFLRRLLQTIRKVIMLSMGWHQIRKNQNFFWGDLSPAGISSEEEAKPQGKETYVQTVYNPVSD